MQIAVVCGVAAVLLYLFDQTLLSTVAVFIGALGTVVGLAGRASASPQLQPAGAGTSPAANAAFAAPLAAGAGFALATGAAVPVQAPTENEAELVARLEADFGDVSFDDFELETDPQPAAAGRAPVRQAPSAATSRKAAAHEVHESGISAGMLDIPRPASSGAPSSASSEYSPRDDRHLFEHDHSMQVQDPGPAGVAFHQAFTVNDEAFAAKQSMSAMESEAWVEMPDFGEPQ